MIQTIALFEGNTYIKLRSKNIGLSIGETVTLNQPVQLREIQRRLVYISRPEPDMTAEFPFNRVITPAVSLSFLDLKCILLTALFAVLLSCAPPPVTDPFIFQNDGIQIDLKADHMLNTFDGEAHSIKLVIYQLTDNAAFKERLSSQDGMRELLRVSRFDNTVASFEQSIVKPNDSRLLKFDRSTGARWIGVVAGYYTHQGNNLPPAILLEIPTKAMRKNLIRRFGEFSGITTPYDSRYVPPFFFQLVFTPVTMYETSIFR